MLRPIVRSSALALLCLLGLLLLPMRAAAQVGGYKIEPSYILSVPPAEVRTTPNFEPSTLSTRFPDLPVEVPFRPTINAQEYARLKAAADRQLPLPTGMWPSLYGPPIPDVDFDGLNQSESGNLIPPDTHGAIGKEQFIEVVNSRLAVFDRTGNRLKDVSLATFFRYTARTLFDPRVVYDRTHDRWVVTAAAFPESSTVQFHFIGVSTTGDATGDFFVYPINVAFIPDDLWDYPQLGMDKDALIITANIFHRGVFFRWADMLAVPKDNLYNGLGFSVPVFQGLDGSLNPPIVLDDNPKTFLINNMPGTAFVGLYVLENSGDPDNVTLFVLSPVEVGLYSIPPSARQPETGIRIDTVDTRFVNASIQNGGSLFNVHTIGVEGLPKPRWYEIDISTSEGMVVQSGIFFGTVTSDDWNASIALNDDNDVFVTWSSSASPNGEEPGYFPQIRASGRLSTDPPGVIEPGSVIFQSPTFSTHFRWGDYSAITIDPLNPQCAFGVNEKVNSSSQWGSHLFGICFPSNRLAALARALHQWLDDLIAEQ